MSDAYFVQIRGLLMFTNQNIAGRLSENSRNSFVDLHSQKECKKPDQKILIKSSDVTF